MGVELSVRHTCVVCTILPTVGTVYSIVIFPLRLGANREPATGVVQPYSRKTYSRALPIRPRHAVVY